ncbi:hypothetical protein [Kineococcus terrestris]|uniref:hypothetical protein n=1 Tax=Kineococcus terrestris TaxID=2044856 RepID=UPI0034DB11BF
MDGRGRNWWNLTRTRGHSLAFGLLWLVVTLLQASLLTGGDVPWWRWALVVLMAGLSAYYLTAWWVRGQREDGSGRR